MTTQERSHRPDPGAGGRIARALCVGIVGLCFPTCVEAVLEDDADTPASDVAADVVANDATPPSEDTQSDGGSSVVDLDGSENDGGTDPAVEGDAATDGGDDVATDIGGHDPALESDAATHGAECPDDCRVAPSTCFDAPGDCIGGDCVFAFHGVNAVCDDDDPCTLDDRCDDLGSCEGLAIDCRRPHTEGGGCVGGVCGDWTCEWGWGDCNDDKDVDGCETPLTTAQDCGGCDVPCAAGAHAEADCSDGTCVRSCESPWENCDEDWSNGCEIPTGVANRCDAEGLNDVDGCWTAYCGSYADPDAWNFGTWFCFECTTCHVPAAGRCQWCSHSTGRWFPDDACACGAYEDDVCQP